MHASDPLERIMSSLGHLNQVSESPTFDPGLNLARETHNWKELPVPSYRVWRSSDSVVLGRFLEPGKEVRIHVAEELGVPVLFRPSGGGAIFHDLGNINYSIYLPGGLMEGIKVDDALRILSFPVTGLLDSLAVPWSWEPPNNVCIMGKKVSGSAQARSGGRLLHHGTLLVETDLQKMKKLLKPGGRSKLSPVANLSELREKLSVEHAERLMVHRLEAAAGVVI